MRLIPYIDWAHNTHSVSFEQSKNAHSQPSLSGVLKYNTGKERAPMTMLTGIRNSEVGIRVTTQGKNRHKSLS